MRLKLITELNLDRAISNIRPLFHTMPNRKRKHSKRVAKDLKRAGVGKIGIYTGLLHDYLERGGDPASLAQHIGELGLPDDIVSAVHSLSADEVEVDEAINNRPLAHLRQVLGQIDDPDLRNIIILAKLSDRLDNLRRRVKRGGLGRNYNRKSGELIQWLVSQYTGEPKPLNKLLKQIIVWIS